MPSAARHCMQRIAQRALERVASDAPIHLHVPDGRLASLDHGLERPGDPTLLA